jgi:hypothetical protein
MYVTHDHPAGQADGVDYALWWFGIQIVCTGATIVLGLVAWRHSTIEQAIQSRTFIATPHHYRPADTMSMANGTGMDWHDGLANSTVPYYEYEFENDHIEEI